MTTILLSMTPKRYDMLSLKWCPTLKTANCSYWPILQRCFLTARSRGAEQRPRDFRPAIAEPACSWIRDCGSFAPSDTIAVAVAGWCNCSTADSGSVSLGSNPSPAARLAHSSSGPGHRPLKAEITGSNPVCATTTQADGGTRPLPPFLLVR